jgi:anion-transporting  ArsA/GET3 family ATPase
MIDETQRMESLKEVIADREVVLCTGPGGVGKTTVSAAIGLAAAISGRKVAVLTIDPARRLADALGVTLDNTPRRIDPALFAAAGLTVPGELWALMLDAGSTFDDLIRRLSPDPRASDRILRNPVYTHMSRSLAGTLEYMAIEKLFDIRERHKFDLVIVDTPPSKNVLDFLEAPEWLTRFLDERVLKWFLLLHPDAPHGGFAKMLLQRTGKVVFDVLGKVFGREFLAELVAFMHAIESMTAEFQRRAHVIQELLRSERSSFLVIATSDQFVLRDAVFLRHEIDHRGIPFGGFVVNRVHSVSGITEPERAKAAIRAAGADDPAAERLADKLVGALAEMDRQAALDHVAIAALRRQSSWEGYIGELPALGDEVLDLKGLARLSAQLAAREPV